MSLVKIPFLLSGAVANYVTMTPPTPMVPPEQRAKEVTAFERLFSSSARLLALCIKMVTVSGGIVEVLVITANHFPSHPLSQKILDALIVGPPSLARRIAFSPLFLAGTAIGIAGSYLRWQCYHALGRLFTFEVSIREQHKLITTGPYSYVRHPAYAGAFASTYGLSLTYVAPGSWLRECGILRTRGARIAIGAYVALVLYSSIAVLRRAPQEDALLRKEFGEEWNAWAKKVPYRIFPFIF
ncbi:hypothetical protein DAEQUDRAFT_709353 [Daedalea quercina L-15889]|uniref:Protein-S-isoprenylcysteine O-methyltransferase n=1 Tax=Daedalea quercina L-15889 TaxID=1314783 RepID=A0A165QVL1_9APHY|nr:hypothetical protein DAEQUDRAFT_709353 [Daedalea quercina L-15889]